MCVSYQATVAGVLDRVDHAELVQHLTDDDDTDPDGGQAGGHRPEAAVGHGQRPQHHQDQVHHRRLWDNTETRGCSPHITHYPPLVHLGSTAQDLSRPDSS